MLDFFVSEEGGGLLACENSCIGLLAKAAGGAVELRVTLYEVKALQGKGETGEREKVAVQDGGKTEGSGNRSDFLVGNDIPVLVFVFIHSEEHGAWCPL